MSIIEHSRLILHLHMYLKPNNLSFKKYHDLKLEL